MRTTKALQEIETRYRAAKNTGSIG